MNLKNTPGFKLAYLTRQKRQLIDIYLSELSLSRTQWQVLICLQIISPPIYQQDILKNLDIDAAHLARVLEQLETENYITRKQAENNRRCLIIHATKKGEKTINYIKEAVAKETQLLFSGFTTDEQTQFIKLLDKMTMNVLTAITPMEI
ncbi:MAG: MarR family transcriptional regulator [Gammaproteobacteria bacterium]